MRDCPTCRRKWCYTISTSSPATSTTSFKRDFLAMKTSLLLSLFAAVSLSVVACASPTNDAEDGDGSSESTNDELRTAGIVSIEIGRSTGFVPPPPPGGCRASGRYSVNFQTKSIKGQGCVDNRQVIVNRNLSADEFNKVKKA